MNPDRRKKLNTLINDLERELEEPDHFIYLPGIMGGLKRIHDAEDLTDKQFDKIIGGIGRLGLDSGDFEKTKLGDRVFTFLYEEGLAREKERKEHEMEDKNKDAQN